MGHDTDSELAYESRDLLRRLFIQAMDVETLSRFQNHSGGVIKIDLLRGSAVFASGHTYPDLLLKLRGGLGDLTNVSLQDLRIRARVTFETANRSCVIAAGTKQRVQNRSFIVCKIKGKSVVKVGKWRVWSADPWEHRVDWPELEGLQEQTGV
jgi:hypothetical protein